MEFASSDEKEETERMVNVSKVFFTIRYRSDVTAKTKIEWESKTYEIDGLLPEGRNQYLKLLTRVRS